MHKTLLVLGMLLHGPLYGYEMHRIVRAHGELYADLKKANLYYLLEHLAKDGYLSVEAEAGARGARGERLIYALTDKGRARFSELLREVMLSYEPVHTGIGTAVVFLAELPAAEGIALLEQRRRIMTERRAQIADEMGGLLNDEAPTDKASTREVLVRIAADHLVSLVDAELAWIDRSLARLRAIDWAGSDRARPQHKTREE